MMLIRFEIPGDEPVLEWWLESTEYERLRLRAKEHRALWWEAVCTPSESSSVRELAA